MPSTYTCDYITTSAECEAAAGYLGLSDTSATPSPITSWDNQYDPPYCYIENGNLQFNGAGTNTGPCGSDNGMGAAYLDKCLCKILITTTATTTTTTTTATTTTGKSLISYDVHTGTLESGHKFDQFIDPVGLSMMMQWINFVSQLVTSS